MLCQAKTPRRASRSCTEAAGGGWRCFANIRLAVRKIILNFDTKERVMIRGFFMAISVLIGFWSYAQDGRKDSSVRSAFESVVAEVENHYAGFFDKVNVADRPSYETMLAELRSRVSENNATDCVGKYLAWFGDLHLCASVSGHRIDTYERKPVNYADSMVYAPRLSAGKINDDCFLLRIPTLRLRPGPRNPLVRMIRQYKRSGCPFLIIDLRGNTGGNDGYLPLLELAFDHAGVTERTTFRNTGENRAFLLAGMKGNRDIEKSVRLSISKSDSLAVLREESIQSFKKVSYAPRRLAVILDNQVASNAENLILALRSVNNRVVLYGRDSSLGCADYTNSRPFAVSSLDMVVMIPTCRSGRLPEHPVDPVGIAPDVRIPLPLPDELTNNLDTWTLWVAKDLATSK